MAGRLYLLQAIDLLGTPELGRQGARDIGNRYLDGRQRSKWHCGGDRLGLKAKEIRAQIASYPLEVRNGFDDALLDHGINPLALSQHLVPWSVQPRPPEPFARPTPWWRQILCKGADT